MPVRRSAQPTRAASQAAPAVVATARVRAGAGAGRDQRDQHDGRRCEQRRALGGDEAPGGRQNRGPDHGQTGQRNHRNQQEQGLRRLVALPCREAARHQRNDRRSERRQDRAEDDGEAEVDDQNAGVEAMTLVRALLPQLQPLGDERRCQATADDGGEGCRKRDRHQVRVQGVAGSQPVRQEDFLDRGESLAKHDQTADQRRGGNHGPERGWLRVEAEGLLCNQVIGQQGHVPAGTSRRSG
jgi:hypothetical protein